MYRRMYRNKKDVDKHVESLMYKLTPKDFKTRAYSIARLYYEVGDYRSCQKYVEQYLTQKSNNAAAHKLLGQAFQKFGEKDKALEQYKTSFDIDPTQTSTILDVCELLADDEVATDPGRAKYWSEKAESIFPKHSVTFRLRERLLAITDPNPEALVKLLKNELESRPNDALLHGRLLKHYLNVNKYKEAFEHSCNIEFDKNAFSNNFVWYETLSEVLNYNPIQTNDWLHQLLLLTVQERLCMLSLTEIPHASTKSLIESNTFLHAYDQAIESVAKSGAPSGFGEFHAGLLQHHQGQLVYHIATYLLKKAKKDQLNWRDAKIFSSPLMLLAWHTIPLDTKVNWLVHAPEKQRNAAHRWFLEGSYRCSQSGHYLLSMAQDKSQVLLDQISQLYSGTNWKDKLYGKIFTIPDQLAKIKSSYIGSQAFTIPALRLPRKIEVQTYDNEAQREHPSSLHHFVWILLNYKNFADFKCTLFDMLTPSVTSCGPETMNKMDVLAFLYSTALTTQKQRDNKKSYISTEKPMLPANITDLLCTLPQMKWWDCAYKLSQNVLGVEYTDIRSTLSRGIEVVRCIDNHGLDPELLTILGRIFSEQAKTATTIEEKTNYELRACLYYSSAIPLLEKLKNKVVVKISEKRLFNYSHEEIDYKEINNLLEESKLYVALNHLNDGEYEKVIKLLSCLKSPQAFYHLSSTYKKIALEEKRLSKTIDSENKFLILLEKAKENAYKALDKLKEVEMANRKPLYTDIQELIEEIEMHINRADHDLSSTVLNDASSDENISANEFVSIRSKPNPYRNVSSTPKQILRQNANLSTTAYRTATDSHILENTRVDQIYLEQLEKQIKNLQKRDTSISQFMEQTKDWFEENRKLGSQISAINSNIENNIEQFRTLKISVNQVKEQLDDCRNVDVVELKKQIADLKKEVNKLKKTSSDQAIDESDLYNLDDEYRSNDNTTFGAQLPFTTPQVMPPFAQRLMPPFSIPSNPYQLYGQNFYNLYNQYSQFSQPSAVPGAPSIFDPTRAPMNYSGVYPTPEQMYLDAAHLVPPTIPAAPNVQAVPIPTPIAQPAATIATSKVSLEQKETTKTLPVNVVITSSDPLPTCTTTPAPVLSVTIPQKHIKGSPHNYQIPMPVTSENKVALPVFSFPPPNNKLTTSVTLTTPTWNAKSIFMTAQQPNKVSSFGTNDKSKNSDDSKSVVDGLSPNTSLNKSRTLSEKSNTSIENYDPCPDFKPIIPLPAEVKVTTGEEDETVIFNSRAKLFRFVDKQWKERGIGEIKLLKHKITARVRVLMRREQVHKICANHIISPEMEIKPMKNESKAYFWVANDFAEETVILEKFCIRFKTADIAKDFYDAFEKARKEAENHNINAFEPKKNLNVLEVNNKSGTSVTNSAPMQTGKTVIGGFTFSSIPSFKDSNEPSNTDKTVTTVPTSKINVFSGLTFKTATSTPFSSVFNVTTNASNNVIHSSEKVVVAAAAGSSKLDSVDEFVPTAEFKPVVPLPALIDQKTGEEDEIILFEHRAKLLRFDGAGKEWKERGLGNIKLLVHKDNNQKLRLLMRREQIMKVCCNHTVSKEMVFQKMPNMDKAVTWCAKDFSEGELVAETFCLRFKTVQTCNDFIDAVKTAQSNIGDDIKAAKEEKNAATQNSSIGFGEKFKSKAGSWYCDTCYTNNLESFLKCACCETQKPQKIEQINEDSKSNSTSSDWGATFKPKPGTWECKECYIRNNADNECCIACNSSKDPTAKKMEANSVAENKLQFNFGIPSTGTNSNSEVNSNTSKPKFTFGIPQGGNVKSNESVLSSSLFNTNVTQKFSFGIPQNKAVTFGIATDTAPVMTINVPKTTVENERPTNYVVTKNEEEAVTPVKPALLATPKTSVTPFGNESGTFEFSFKPKPLSKGKSPSKSPKDKKGNESDDNEYVSEDEGHHIHFSPVIPMPDKIEVVTGEEDEDELYGHRARLFRFANGEWKERGTGVVKILKHKKTQKLRVVMRREQIYKICLNHALTDITYKPKDERTWIFAAHDFSEGEVMLQQFCIRFANKDIAMEFKNAIDKALDAKHNIKRNNNNSEDVIFVTEIQASSEEKEKAKELMLPENFFTYKVKEPCQGCRGCDYDEDDVKPESDKTVLQDFKLSTEQDSNKSTPLKTSFYGFHSPSNSFYGTPSNLDKTVDNSVFRTPLSSFASNIKDGTNSPINKGFVENDSPDKELINPWLGTMIENSKTISKPISFGSGGNFSSILAAPKLSTVSVPNNNAVVPKSPFETTEAKSIIGENKSIFGNTVTSSQNSVSGFKFQNSEVDVPTTDVKSIFSQDVKSSVNLFSSDSYGSLFGPTVLKTNQQSSGIFGPTGTFTFGNIAKPNQDDSKSIFGSVISEKPTSKSEVTTNTKDEIKADVQSGNFVFGNITEPQNTGKLVLGSHSSDKTTAVDVKAERTVNESSDSKTNVEPVTINVSTAKDKGLFEVDNVLTFASLSSSGPGFGAQKKTDFQWEGTGQQLFSAGSTKEAGDKSKSDTGAADESVAGAGAEEEYDPHYEPIVPLPDKIIVTTGEEDEEKVYGERCKLYRFDEKSREWKERGVGEMKILYHPERNSYRLLLRREQVHKAVLNMLLFADLELLPLKNSDRAWTWAGRNYAENTGEQETLAVRFKSVALATTFRDKAMECVRNLQVAASEAIKKDKEANEKQLEMIPPLRLPKHLGEAARPDISPSLSIVKQEVQTLQDPNNTQIGSQKSETNDEYKQVHFEEPEEDHGGYDEEDYDQDYDHNEDSDGDYEEDEDSSVYHPCKATIKQGDIETVCESTHVFVSFDQEIYSPKILVTDSTTGEILADMLIHTDTEFQLSDDTCTWSGMDYTTNVSVEKSVTIKFLDSHTAMEFYDSCETSKAATFASTDPES